MLVPTPDIKKEHLHLESLWNLITVRLLLRPKSQQESHKKVGSQILASRIKGIQSVTCYTTVLFSPTWEIQVSLKLVSAIFNQIFIFSPNYSPLKTMKNVFYFI